MWARRSTPPPEAEEEEGEQSITTVEEKELGPRPSWAMLLVMFAGRFGPCHWLFLAFSRPSFGLDLACFMLARWSSSSTLGRVFGLARTYVCFFLSGRCFFLRSLRLSFFRLGTRHTHDQLGIRLELLPTTKTSSGDSLTSRLLLSFEKVNAPMKNM